MIEIIDLLKPKNGGSFKLIEDIDIAVNGYSSLADCVAHMATTAMIDAINAVMSGKANASDVATAEANLQNQINQIEISASAEAVVAPEVAAARVDANGVTHATLKARIDSDYNKVEGNIGTLTTAMATVNNELYDKKEYSFNNDNGLADISNATYGLYFTEATFVKQFKLRNPSVATIKYRYVETVDGEPFAENKLLVCSDEYSVAANEPIVVNQVLGSNKGIIFDAGTYKYCYSTASDLSKYKILQVTSYGAENVRIQRAMDYCFAGEITIADMEERIADHTSYESKDLNNNLNLWHTVSTATYALYCTSPTYVKRITPLFRDNTGTFSYRYLYDNTGNGFASNSTVSLGEIHTASVGSSITVERFIDNKTGLLIYSDAVLDYCHSDNVPVTAAKIMSVENGLRIDASTTRITALIDDHFAGAFRIEEKTDKYVKKTELAQFSNNYLYQKKIMAVGDSMVQGHNLSSDKVWLSKIAVRNDMTADNRGKNGAFMSNRQYGGQDNSVYQKLCVPSSEFYISTEDLSSCNYILIYAGTNDCEVSVTIGELDSTTPTEFCGALNLICQALQTRAPKAHIGFITPYLREGKESRCQTYVDAIKNVCAKYSIPVFDNAKYGSICWSSTAIKTALTLNDTYHLNEAGMDFVSLKYEQFLRSI